MVASGSAFGAVPNAPVAALLDLVRMEVELPCQLDHGLLLARSIMLRLRGKSTYPACQPPGATSGCCHELTNLGGRRPGLPAGQYGNFARPTVLVTLS